MPPTILALLLASAMLHAGWNFLVKRAGQKLVFTWWAILAGFIAFCPVLLFGPRLPLRVWPYALASTLFEVAYFYTLTRAYDRGDFSLVYPIARGTAPGLLVVWSALFLGELPRRGGLAGLALLLLGLIVVGGAQWMRRARVTLGFGGVAAALATATCISLYSAVDGGAVRFAPPVTYAVMIQGLIALTSAPDRRRALRSHSDGRRVARELAAHYHGRPLQSDDIHARADCFLPRAGQLRRGGARGEHRLRRAGGLVAARRTVRPAPHGGLAADLCRHPHHRRRGVEWLYLRGIMGLADYQGVKGRAMADQKERAGSTKGQWRVDQPAPAGVAFATRASAGDGMRDLRPRLWRRGCVSS